MFPPPQAARFAVQRGNSAYSAGVGITSPAAVQRALTRIGGTSLAAPVNPWTSTESLRANPQWPPVRGFQEVDEPYSFPRHLQILDYQMTAAMMHYRLGMSLIYAVAPPIITNERNWRIMSREVLQTGFARVGPNGPANTTRWIVRVEQGHVERYAFNVVFQTEAIANEEFGERELNDGMNAIVSNGVTTLVFCVVSGLAARAKADFEHRNSIRTGRAKPSPADWYYEFTRYFGLGGWEIGQFVTAIHKAATDTQRPRDRLIIAAEDSAYAFADARRETRSMDYKVEWRAGETDQLERAMLEAGVGHYAALTSMSGQGEILLVECPTLKVYQDEPEWMGYQALRRHIVLASEYQFVMPDYRALRADLPHVCAIAVSHLSSQTAGHSLIHYENAFEATLGGYCYKDYDSADPSPEFTRFMRSRQQVFKPDYYKRYGRELYSHNDPGVNMRRHLDDFREMGNRMTIDGMEWRNGDFMLAYNVRLSDGEPTETRDTGHIFFPRVIGQFQEATIPTKHLISIAEYLLRRFNDITAVLRFLATLYNVSHRAVERRYDALRTDTIKAGTPNEVMREIASYFMAAEPKAGEEEEEEPAVAVQPVQDQPARPALQGEFADARTVITDIIRTLPGFLYQPNAEAIAILIDFFDAALEHRKHGRLITKEYSLSQKTTEDHLKRLREVAQMLKGGDSAASKSSIFPLLEDLAAAFNTRGALDAAVKDLEQRGVKSLDTLRLVLNYDDNSAINDRDMHPILSALETVFALFRMRQETRQGWTPDDIKRSKAILEQIRAVRASQKPSTRDLKTLIRDIDDLDKRYNPKSTAPSIDVKSVLAKFPNTAFAILNEQAQRLQQLAADDPLAGQLFEAMGAAVDQAYSDDGVNVGVAEQVAKSIVGTLKTAGVLRTKNPAALDDNVVMRIRRITTSPVSMGSSAGATVVPLSSSHFSRARELGQGPLPPLSGVPAGTPSRLSSKPLGGFELLANADFQGLTSSELRLDYVRLQVMVRECPNMDPDTLFVLAGLLWAPNTPKTHCLLARQGIQLLNASVMRVAEHFLANSVLLTNSETNRTMMQQPMTLLSTANQGSEIHVKTILSCGLQKNVMADMEELRGAMPRRVVRGMMTNFARRIEDVETIFQGGTDVAGGDLIFVLYPVTETHTRPCPLLRLTPIMPTDGETALNPQIKNRFHSGYRLLEGLMAPAVFSAVRRQLLSDENYDPDNSPPMCPYCEAGPIYAVDATSVNNFTIYNGTGPRGQMQHHDSKASLDLYNGRGARFPQQPQPVPSLIA